MLKRFFIFCSGADSEILSTCPNFEKNKYASIGATVFFTGLFAFISGSYAIYRVFYIEPEQIANPNNPNQLIWVQDNSPILWGILMGIVWAMMIFNLDRYIVMSMRKTGRLWDEIWIAIPRFIIAVIISLVIAKPLEVRIFEKRILRQIQTNELEQRDLDNKRVDTAYRLTTLSNKLDEEEKEIKTYEENKKDDPTDTDFINLLSKIKDLESNIAQYKKQEREKQRKISGVFSRYTYLDTLTNKRKRATLSKHLPTSVWKGISGTVSERDALTRKIENTSDEIITTKENIEKRRAEYVKSMNQKITEANKDKIAAKEELFRQEAEARAKKDKLNDTNKTAYSENFITQIEALGTLTQWQEDKYDDEGNLLYKANNTMWWVSGLLMLLFIVIETAPIVVKLMSKKGVYDEKRKEYEVLSEQMIEDNIQTQIALNRSNNQSIVQVDLSSNQKLLEKITNAQVEIAEQVVDNWKKEELSKINISVPTNSQSNHNP